MEVWYVDVNPGNKQQWDIYIITIEMMLKTMGLGWESVEGEKVWGLGWGSPSSEKKTSESNKGLNKDGEVGRECKRNSNNSESFISN